MDKPLKVMDYCIILLYYYNWYYKGNVSASTILLRY
ncbi:MAG: hypothetical protein JWQ85_872 [Mucilaginibacter sp.]|jgi:hypothetical protein|nr:hypothetical protein [Mucilaginibacter sp.]